jgi:hypothetical protein
MTCLHISSAAVKRVLFTVSENSFITLRLDSFFLRHSRFGEPKIRSLSFNKSHNAISPSRGEPKKYPLETLRLQ